MTRKKRIVILGGGFIGSAVAEAARASGVRAVTLARTHGEQHLDLRSIADVTSALERDDSVVVTAWPYAASARATGDLFDEALLLTFSIATACRRGGTGRVVFLSSGGTVYGARLRAREEDPTAPVVPLGYAKLACEGVMASVLANACIVARLGNVYGPGQRPGRPGSIVATAFACLRGDEPFTLWGSLDDVRDYVHVSDVAHAIMALILGSPRRRVYNIGSGRGTTTRTILRLCEKAIGTSLRIEEVDRPSSWTSAYSLDTSRMKEEFSWQPTVTLNRGILELAAECTS